MADAGFVILMIGFFALGALLVRGFDRIVRSDDEDTPVDSSVDPTGEPR